MQPDFPLPRPPADTSWLSMADPPSVAAPGLVITPPDQLAGPLIPYASTDRTPDGPLQDLEPVAASAAGVVRDRLVSREGEVTNDGAACLFEIAPHEGDQLGDGGSWVIAAQRAGRLRLRLRHDEAAAREQYKEARQWLAR